MPDVGLTHVALEVTDPERSLEFYRRFAGLLEVHRRRSEHTGRDVVWLSDRTRPFVVVLLPVDAGRTPTPLAAMNHLGVGCHSRSEVDRLLADARAAGHPVVGPQDAGYPVGYWGLVTDPDGHTLELAFGQEVALTVGSAEDDA